MLNILLKRFAGACLSLILLGAMVGTASSATYELCTGATTLTMPDLDGAGGQPPEVITVWGFGIDDASPACLSASVPGPVLEVPAGDPSLTIVLRNTLPEPVSLNILGQQLDRINTGGVPQGPVWTELNGAVVANPRPGNYSARVRSFAHEAPTSGVKATYTWPNFKPGTYLLQSGTNPAKQVQMGLYASVKKDAAPGVAYADDPSTTTFDESVPYDKELILVYSEVDPLMHAAIAENRYGANPTGPLPHITSSLGRDPKYFLINGKAFDSSLPDGGGLDPINAGYLIGQNRRVLVRFLNAGYDTHVPQLLNMYMKVVAEDGNPYKYHPRQQYDAPLPAGKTVDAVIEPAAPGKFPIFDAMLNQTNNGTAPDGGMLAFVETTDSLCAWDIEPPPDGDLDVDGLDFAAALVLPGFDPAAFALEFGRTGCP